MRRCQMLPGMLLGRSSRRRVRLATVLAALQATTTSSRLSNAAAREAMAISNQSDQPQSLTVHIGQASVPQVMRRPARAAQKTYTAVYEGDAVAPGSQAPAGAKPPLVNTG